MTANPEFDAEVWYNEQMRNLRDEDEEGYDDLGESDYWDEYTED